ncbi:hypothetical protein SUGI_1195680 [Cryptomeria japonica]|uniref:probable LRR receptor-like serine/threonine-protein kinase At4g36180 n=1 Tax=Cryptomeria japonica TaxID=3369 RepID=UPI0024146968|nr:probable LRR receptor-like serine/threonine-protein kinase At4g36180 [Cryptomeria japonica]GLJ55666.1 hypothetical protein SUGI_1195680 [Cryptomeria japonica]
MSSLKYLRFSVNNDSQSNKLEEGITHLRGLEQHRLGYVNFSMAGDSWVGNIASLTNLTALYMYGCGIIGEIPPSFANLSRLQGLALSTNSLRGNIPAFVGALPLVGLSLSNNKLNGSIPSTLGDLSALRYLEMENNCFSGPIPISFAKLSNLEYLDLANNSLNGTFSFFILNNCLKLTLVDLSSNMLTVKISASTIPNFQLEYLGLRQCKITGNFPAFISTQYFIQHLDLLNNSLSGSILNWLWELTPLRFLSLTRNNFSGYFKFQM